MAQVTSEKVEDSKKAEEVKGSNQKGADGPYNAPEILPHEAVHDETYQQKLTDFILNTEIPVLSFRLLAKTNILNLQCELKKIHEIVKVRANPLGLEFPVGYEAPASLPTIDLKRLEHTLHKYGQSLIPSSRDR